MRISRYFLVFSILFIFGCNSTTQKYSNTEKDYANPKLYQPINFKDEDYALLGKVGDYYLYESKKDNSFDFKMEVIHTIKYENYSEIFLLSEMKSHIYVLKNQTEVIYLVDGLRDNKVSIYDLEGLIDFGVSKIKL